MARCVAGQPYGSHMEFMARVLGFGLDVGQAPPRRGRVGAASTVAILLIIVAWPELLVEVARSRAEAIVEAVTQVVQGAAL